MREGGCAIGESGERGGGKKSAGSHHALPPPHSLYFMMRELVACAQSRCGGAGKAMARMVSTQEGRA